MKLETNKFDIKKVNWNHFPNTIQLSQYLLHSDIIQLSSTCSQLRNILKTTIFRKLVLFKGQEFIPSNSDTPSKSIQLDILVDKLRKDYIGKYHFVMHIVLSEFHNKSFVTNLFATFSCITNLELYSNRFIHDRSIIISIIKSLKKLEVLIFDCNLIDTYQAGAIENLKLPNCLKVLNIVRDVSGNLRFDPIENINEEYTELEKISIINNRMLANITASITTLTEVEISNNQYICPKLLTQIFSLNTKLKKITISLESIDSDVINSIFHLKKLYQLNIKKNMYSNPNKMNNLVINTSIKYLCISCNITQNILLSILSSTKHLHTLELLDCDFSNFSTINWSSYNDKISLLHLNCTWNTDFNFEKLLNSTVFDKIRFTNNFELEYYIECHSFDELESWEVIQEDIYNNWEFCLVRKLEMD